MHLIKLLGEQMSDEVDGAIEYAKCALEYKQTRPDLARTYYQLAMTEYDHCSQLHDHAVKVVDEASCTTVEVPQKMLDKWDKRHRELIEKMAEAKTYISMYK